MQRSPLMGTFFGPSYGGPCYGAWKDGKSPAEIHALDKFYPHFIPGDIIVPKDRDSPNFHTHIFVVVEMIGNETGVSIRPFGAKTWQKNSVSSNAYDLATDEEIARAVAKRLNPDKIFSTDEILKMLDTGIITPNEAKGFFYCPIST